MFKTMLKHFLPPWPPDKLKPPQLVNFQKIIIWWFFRADYGESCSQ